LISSDDEKELIFSIAEVLDRDLLKFLLYIITIEAGKKYVVKELEGE
jgi:hypothetical protein